ncbi:MAG: hypothetical protein QOG63_1287, partial [Thermoleophilaceae bacterium]|nr:hypothetical protein [Thermoleophilaceae bacterium]
MRGKRGDPRQNGRFDANAERDWRAGEIPAVTSLRMAGRATRWFIAGALAAALVASGAQAQSGDPSQYCQGDGGPLGMA